MRLMLAKVLPIALLGAIAVSATPGVASAATSRAKVGAVPVMPRGAKVTTTAVPATQKLNLTIALQPRDPQGLAALATAVSTPGSPEFRHYITVPQFASQFGASQLALQAVEASLKADGLDVGTPTANDLTLPVTATAAQAERAFSVSETQVKLRSGRTAYANAQAPTLSASVAPYIQGVLGLDNVNPGQPAGYERGSGSASNALARPHARANVPTNGGPQPCAQAQQQGGLTADTIATAYQFSGLYGAGSFGAGQTIAMFEEEAYNPTDIATYQACYGTNVPVSNVDVAGGPGPVGDDGEAALDIEQAIGLAPKSNVLVYQGPGTAVVQILSTIVSQNVAKVISSSWGLCESLTGGSQIAAESPILQEAAAQGQSFFISSGDSGSNMCYQATADSASPDLSLSVIDPGGQQFATGVGGTILFSNNDPAGGCPCSYRPGDTPVEGVWNDPSTTDSEGATKLHGSGGGISKFFTMPSYQSSAPASLNVTNSNSSAQPCGGGTFCREVPDVSADADPNSGYAIFSNGAWGVTGGTSAAAPLWAAFTALANSSSTCRGTPVGFVNPALYQLAGSSYLNNFTDITTANPLSQQANNDAAYEFSLSTNPNDLFPLQSGYDMATGLGSMLAPHLAAALCGIASPVYTVSVASPGNQKSTRGQGVSLAVRGADSGGAGLGFAASGLPAGLSINPANGVIAGVPTTAGTSTVTVAASDRFKNAGSVSFAWTVVNPPPPPTAKAARVSLKGIGARKPKLAFTLSATGGQPALKSVSISLPSGLKFAGKAKTLKKGLSVKNGKKVKFTTKGKLTITFKKSQRKVTVTIKGPAISVSKSLAKKVRKHKVKKLTVTLKVANTSHRSSKILEKLKVK